MTNEEVVDFVYTQQAKLKRRVVEGKPKKGSQSNQRVKGKKQQ